MRYYYFIELDERRDFYATVRDVCDRTVFQIWGFDIFEDGFMAHKHDMDGLHEYMVDLEIINDDDSLFIANEY